MFELRDVYFSYMGKFPALCGVSLNIEKGQVVAIIGANGSGKSTLLHILDGLIFPDRGTVMAFGVELKRATFSDANFNRSFRSRVGLVFQNPDIQLFSPTVKDDIIFAPLYLGFKEDVIKNRLKEIASLMRIEKILDRAPHQLSVGERRKVSIASILVYQPEVLLLDEPTLGLDPRTSRELIDILMNYRKDNRTIIIATHDLHLVEEISDIVYVLSEDKTIVRYGQVSDVLKEQDFLIEHNLIHIHSHRHKDKIHIHPHIHNEHHG